MQNNKNKTVAACAACFLCFVLVPATQAAEFIPLGHQSGCDTSRAEDVSDDGTVAVGNCSGAVRWTAETGWVALEDLPSGRHPRKANGVSVDGSVVVGDAQIDRGQLESFRWTLADGMESLGEEKDNEALGVSADGSVVVGRGSSQPSDQAYRWTRASGRVGLGDCCNQANGVSADGSVVVGRGSFDSGFEAFRWTSEGGSVGIGDLPGGDFDSAALGASGDGKVIVGWGNSALGRREAFIWTSEGGMVGLGDLPGGDFESRALAVSADGRIVVGYSRIGSFDSPTSTTAKAGKVAGKAHDDPIIDEGFVWTEASGMQRLDDILVADGTAGLSGWSGIIPWGISDNGQWLAGSGTNPSGLYEAFIVRLPDSISEGFTINAGQAGAWFNPETPGQGQLLDVEPESEFMFVSWFTFTDAASANPKEQHWFTAQGNYSGNTADLIVYETLGGQFDDPQEVSTDPVGVASLSFSECGLGQMSYSIETWDVEGSFPMQRAIPGTENVCQQQAGLSNEPLDKNDGWDGAWYDEETPGQGFLIDAHPNAEGDDFIFVAWFTYGDGTASGQRWLTAQGPLAGTTAELVVYETTGGSFDAPITDETNPVGTISIDFTDCSHALLTYALTDEGLEESIQIQRTIPGTDAFCQELNG